MVPASGTGDGTVTHSLAAVQVDMTFPASSLCPSGIHSLPWLSAPMRGGLAVNVNSSLVAVVSTETNTAYIYTVSSGLSTGGASGVQVTGTPVAFSNLNIAGFQAPICFVRRSGVDTLRAG